MVCGLFFVVGDVFRFNIISDEQRQFVFEVKTIGNGRDFLLELTKAVGGTMCLLIINDPTRDILSIN